MCQKKKINDPVYINLLDAHAWNSDRDQEDNVGVGPRTNRHGKTESREKTKRDELERISKKETQEKTRRDELEEIKKDLQKAIRGIHPGKDSASELGLGPEAEKIVSGGLWEGGSLGDKVGEEIRDHEASHPPEIHPRGK